MNANPIRKAIDQVHKIQTIMRGSRGSRGCSGSTRVAGRWCKMVNALLLTFLALYIFIAPAFLLVHTLRDPAWRTGAIPEQVWKIHRTLAPLYATWARERIDSGRAGKLDLHDVPSTEWPMFGSVFFLMATDKLQREWEKDPSHSRVAPCVYAREAIDAASDLVLDPNHHAWVITHWGTNYLHTQNVFFRSLLIAAITARENLLKDGRHLDILRDQIDTLADELDASKFGVLDDYPGECYPIDVLASLAFIKKADTLLHTDHATFLNRARRGFEGARLDKFGLIPFCADPESGEQFQPSRGTGNSWVLILAHDLWPDFANDWYSCYEKHFWQKLGWAEGFREFPIELKQPDYEWGFDVDAGPIMAGFSPAANAFGMAAARVNGRMDHAWTLSGQVLAATWPLPCGQLLGPRILSNQAHAPYLGEACLLYAMVQTPAVGLPIVQGGKLPRCVYYGIAFYITSGLVLLCLALVLFRNALLNVHPVSKIGFGAWLILLLASLTLAYVGWMISALAILGTAILATRVNSIM